MKVTYDADNDIMALFFHKGRTYKTLPVRDNLLIHLNRKGQIIRMQVLHASRLLSPTTFRELEFRLPDEYAPASLLLSRAEKQPRPS